MTDPKDLRRPDPRATDSARLDDESPAGLGEQIGRTKNSFSRLVGAHIDLLKAEINEILGQLKVLGALAGVVLAMALLVGNMLYIGGFLFVGEWLFGSIGWGLAHGVLFGLALIVAVGLAMVGASARFAVASFAVAAVITIAIAALLGTNIVYDTVLYLARQLPSPINSPGIVAALVGALIGAVLFALMLGRMAGRGGAVGGLVIGLLIGALAGWLMGGAPWTWPPAVGFAITFGLIAWPILNLVIAFPGLDPAARFSKLYPKQSIEAANETKAWLEEQWRRRQPKLGRK